MTTIKQCINFIAAHVVMPFGKEEANATEDQCCDQINLHIRGKSKRLVRTSERAGEYQFYNGSFT